jgi:hypothetical protein
MDVAVNLIAGCGLQLMDTMLLRFFWRTEILFANKNITRAYTSLEVCQVEK